MIKKAQDGNTLAQIKQLELAEKLKAASFNFYN